MTSAIDRGAVATAEVTRKAVAPRAVDEPKARVPAADDVAWQRLWLAAQRCPWMTLALVPVGSGVATPPIAETLALVGGHHLGGTIVACDMTSVSLSTLQTELRGLAERARCAERAIIALPPLTASPAGLAIAQAVDAVILCVALRSSAVDEATRIVDEIGRARVLGSVVVNERKDPP